MPEFITEREIEHYLEMETRDILHPDDAIRPMTAMRSLWASLDAVTTMSSYTESDIVGFATVTMREQGCAFKDALTAVVSFIHQEINRRNGY